MRILHRTRCVDDTILTLYDMHSFSKAATTSAALLTCCSSPTTVALVPMQQIIEIAQRDENRQGKNVGIALIHRGIKSRFSSWDKASLGTGA